MRKQEESQQLEAKAIAERQAADRERIRLEDAEQAALAHKAAEASRRLLEKQTAKEQQDRELAEATRAREAAHLASLQQKADAQDEMAALPELLTEFRQVIWRARTGVLSACWADRGLDRGLARIPAPANSSSRG